MKKNEMGYGLYQSLSLIGIESPVDARIAESEWMG